MTAPGNTTTDGAPAIGSRVVKEVFNRRALFAFRAANVFRAVADTKAADYQSPMPGNPVTFNKIRALAAVTAAISETADPTHVALQSDTVSITLAEYGSTVKPTKKLRLTSFLNLDTDAVVEVTDNMEESVDLVARNVLEAGTNVLYVGQASRAAIAATNTMTANHIRRARAELAGGKAPPPAGSTMYVGYLHPDVSYDLQAESGQQAWSAPQIYREGQSGIWTGELGALGGVRLVENANASMIADAGAGSLVDVYLSTFVGLQALGEAVGEAQHVVIAGPFDDLQRFVSIGWYALLGYGRIREESIFRIESASSIGANT